MTILYVFLVISVIALIYMRYEVTLLKLRRIYFTKNSTGLKVVHISDIHLKYLKVSVQKLVRAIKSEKPDIIILTGDYINNASHIPKLLNLLEVIKGDHKICMCFGNHDYKALNYSESKINDLTQRIEAKGVHVLHNSSLLFELHSKRYNIIGIEDLRSGRYDIKKALDTCCTADTNIAISHNPDIVFEIPKGKVDYLLCGHFHGGQIWMPFHLEFKLLRGEKLCKMGIIKGVNKFNGITLYINSGIGSVCFPLRFFSPPEIAVLHFP